MHALKRKHEIVDRPATQVGRVVRRTVVLEHGAAVEAVGVSGAHAARAAGALRGARLRRPHHAPRARARRVVVHTTITEMHTLHM